MRSFEEMFEQKIMLIPFHSCWEWIGSKTNGGYGTVKYNGTTTCAHRVVYTFYKGAIPVGLQIDHLCKNRACVNPNHLEAVTAKENMQRTTKAQQTHCKHGHEFSKENTYIKRNGCRFCKKCKDLSVKKWRNRRQDA